MTAESVEIQPMPEIESKPWLQDDYRLPAGVKTLLTSEEVQMLHSISRKCYTGEGAIVDAGPYLGGSTVALLDGLVENPIFDPAAHRVDSYDLFEVFEDSNTWGDTGRGFTGRYSFLDEFRRNLADRIGITRIHAGDILQEKWTHGPIEILFIDIAKTPEILMHVIREFYPHLMPGKSIVIHQDLQYPLCPWIPVSVHQLKEYFRLIDYLPKNSAVYLLEKAIPEDIISKTDYTALSRQEQRALHELAIEDIPEPGKLLLSLNEVLLNVLQALIRTHQSGAILEVGRRAGGVTWLMAEIMKESEGMKLYSLESPAQQGFITSRRLQAILEERAAFIGGELPHMIHSSRELAGSDFSFIFRSLPSFHRKVDFKSEMKALSEVLREDGMLLLHYRGTPFSDEFVEAVCRECSLQDCGEICVSHPGDADSRSMRSSMRLIRPAAAGSTAQRIHELERKIAHMREKMDRERNNRFWPKVKRSFGKRFGGRKST